MFLSGHPVQDTIMYDDWCPWGQGHWRKKYYMTLSTLHEICTHFHCVLCCFAYISGLMQERGNSIANTLELCLSSINPWILSFHVVLWHLFTHIYQGILHWHWGQSYDCPNASEVTLMDMGKTETPFTNMDKKLLENISAWCMFDVV